MSSIRHAEHEVVRLVGSCGPWAAGTVGTVVHADARFVLVEIVDGTGETLDFVSLPHEGLVVADTPGFGP